MKREILIITFLIGNIALGATMPIKTRVVREIDTNKKNIHTLFSSVGKYLHNKGLEKSVAEQKVLQSLGDDEHIHSVMAQNIVDGFSEIKHNDIIAYVGDCALFGKKVDLSSYDAIVALLQKKKKLNLDKKSLEKAHKIARENISISHRFV